MRTAATHPAAGKAAGREQGVWRRRFGDALTGLAIWLPLIASAGHVVVFTAWTTWVSFTASSVMPDYAWVGLRNYFAVTRTANFKIAYVNLVIFGCGFPSNACRSLCKMFMMCSLKKRKAESRKRDAQKRLSAFRFRLWTATKRSFHQ